MKTMHKPRGGFTRPAALLTASAVVLPTLIAGCGGGGQTTQTSQFPPGVGSTSAQPRQGMTGKQKMMLLAGAAALYYLYNKRKNASQNGQVQYYRSETSGRIYYRDPRTKQPVFVSPPRTPIQVPMEEAQQYQGYAGYNNQANGQNYGGYGYNPNGSYQGGVPAEIM